MPLGSVVIDLLVKTGSLVTDTDRAAKHFDRRMKEMGHSAKIAGAALGGALVVGITAFARATIEAEKVQAQLASRIKDTAGAAGRSLEQLSKYADAMSSRTIFDDEAIGGAQAMLLTFKGIQGVQFDQTIEAAADLATVMGTDIADAAKLLGKALTEPEEGFGALKKAGITFTEAQQKSIKAMAEAGEVARAQDMILDELASTMGTAAEAARGTLGGSLTNLGNAFENLLEGDTSAGGMRGTVDAINDLGEIMRSDGVKQGFSTMIEGLADIASVSVNAIAELANMASTVNQAFTADRDKSYQGLLEKRLKLDDRLATEQDRTVFRSEAVIARIEGEIAALDDLIAVRRALHALPDPADFANRGTLLNDTVTISAGEGFGEGGGRSGGGGGTSKAMRDAEAAARDAAREVDDFLRSLGDLRAEQEGPAATALLRYNRLMEESQGFLAEHPEMLKAVTEWQGLLRTELEKTVPALKKNADLLKEWGDVAKEFEGKGLTDSQLEHIGEMDGVREALSDSIADAFRTGDVRGAVDDFTDYLGSRLYQRLADSMVDALLGAPGQSGGGLLGGGSWLNALLGIGSGGGLGSNASSLASVSKDFLKLPGFANGTDYAPGGWAMVGERGPEIVNLPRGSQVIPHGRGAGGVTIHNTINVQPTTTKETASQIARRVGEASQRAIARS